jgi:SsrA-binding protein
MGRAKKQIEKKKKKTEQKQAQTKSGTATVARNKKAGFDFHLGKDIVAGLVLTGPEVKSVRLGNVQLKGAFAKIIDDEVWLFNCHIAEYKNAQNVHHEANRAKKLLLKRYEIERLALELQRSNQTIVCSKIFFKKNKAKALLHLAEGKQKADKRADLKRRQQNMDIERAVKNY